jgi:hypothetical protein
MTISILQITKLETVNQFKSNMFKSTQPENNGRDSNSDGTPNPNS